MRPRAITAALAAALLAACGTVARRPTEPQAAGATPPAAQSAPAASGTRGGGYYKDDGPGPHPPDLASIAEPQPKLEPLNAAANRPYQAFGKEYVPLTRVQPFRERGLASWYGRRYDGLKTSSGERYNMYALTAAHPVLPIPSYARVTDLASGRSVVVRINDRGPFWPGRIIDLSYAAAYKLGIVDGGSATVEVDGIVPGEPQPAEQTALATPVATPQDPPAAPDAVEPAIDREPPGFYLQLGAFSARGNAESFRARVYRELAWLSEAIHVFANGGLYKLHLGPYRTAEEARTVAARIQTELNFRPVFLAR